jgi:ferredoxin
MRIDKARCTGCGNCVPVCTMGAIYIGPDKRAEVEQEACVECHACYRGMSVENLPAGITRFLRQCLAAVKLRFQPEPDICPTGALVPDDLTWPRSIRRAFSDPQVPHESTGGHGRGTKEVKTNEITGRVKEGEAGVMVEFGRPGVGAYFRDVDMAAQKLAAVGATFERDNPVTYLMTDPKTGRIREDVLNEKVLSCILEFKATLDNLPRVLNTIEAFAPALDTVISVGAAVRCNADGDHPVRKQLTDMGYNTYRAKVNLGMGRRTVQQEAQEVKA